MDQSEVKKMIIDGQIIDFDKTPIEELKKLQKKLEEKEKKIKEAIEKELEMEEDNMSDEED